MSKIKIITGATGSGKTYRAMQLCKGKKFVYIAPTGALCFDTYKQYQAEDDSLSALGVEIAGAGNHFTSYNLNFNFDDYDCVIIDECHWAFEFPQHGFVVNEILTKFKGKIILITGTVNFEIPENWEIEKLESNSSFYKEAVSFDVAFKLMRLGKPTLVLVQTIHEFSEFQDLLDKNNLDYRAVRSGCSALKLYKACADFNDGKIKILLGTNILAQGINLACENLITQDRYLKGNHTCDLQKFGRLGRMGITNSDALLTYCCDFDVDAPLLQWYSFDELPTEPVENDAYQPPVMSEDETKEFINLIKKRINHGK